MKPVDILILAVLAAIMGLAVWAIRKSKKSGKRCIGCPDGGSCSGHCSGCGRSCSGCGQETE